MINSAQFHGNLTADPKITYTASNIPVLNATLANTHKYTTDSGEQRKETAFVGITMWGALAKSFASFHRKGTPALVDGRLVTDVWEDKQTGQKKSKTKIRVQHWHFVGPKRDPIDLPQNTQPPNIPFS